MRGLSLLIVVVATLIGCASPLPLEGRRCPCAGAYVCCEKTQMCTTAEVCAASSVDSEPKPEFGANARLWGTVINHHRTDTGTLDVVDQVGLQSVKVLVEKDGVFTPLPVQTDDQGRFKVVDGPEGELHVRIRSNTVVTDKREIHLDQWILGRPETSADFSEHALALQFSGLSAQPTSEFQIESSNAGGFGWIYPESEINSSTYAASTPVVFPRVESAQGDSVTILQMTRRDAGTGDYIAAASASTLTNITFPDAGTYPLTAVFKPLAQQPVSVTIEASSYTNVALAADFTAIPKGQTVSLTPAAGGIADGWLGYSGELLKVSTEGSVLSGIHTFAYGNPHPSNWTLLINYQQTFEVPRGQLTGPNSGGRRTSLSETVELSKLAGRAFTARLGPVRNLRVDGVPALATLTHLIGTPVVVEWEAPALGAPSRYAVGLYRIDVSGGFTSIPREGSVFTGQTRAVIPRELLKESSDYLIEVRAELGAPEPTTPFRYLPVESSFATNLTGIIQVR